jgi:hypothetical protein
MSILIALAASFSINLSTLDLGVLQMPLAVETDGHHATREWMVTRFFSAERRIAAVYGSTLCLGPAFVADTTWYHQRANPTDVLTRMHWPMFEVIELAAYHPQDCR